MSYTPFKMAPKGPIMKKMLSASQKSQLPTELKKGMVDSGEYGGPLQFEKDPDEFTKRKDKETGVESKMTKPTKPKKSTVSVNSPLEPDATNDYKSDMDQYNKKMVQYNKQSKTPKNRADFNPGYEGADISEAEYKRRLKSGSTKRD